MSDPTGEERRRRTAPRRGRLLGVPAFIVALALTLLPAPASAETTVTIDGGGFGHGIGMSQYGAYGQALAGRNASQILTHYYTGVELASSTMPRIRVGLLRSTPSISLFSSAGETGTGEVRFKVAGKRKAIAKGTPEDSWSFEPTSSGGVLLFKNDAPVLLAPLAPESILVKFARFGSRVRVVEKARDYAYGRLEVGAYASTSCPAGYCLRLIGQLGMERYLYGLGEVPSSWPVEALKAQIIAARTYAYRKHVQTGDHRQPCDCTILDSAAEQVYLGDTKRTSSGAYWTRWTEAVDSTAGTVLLYKGQPIIAMYSASSGGHTEDNENIWGTAAVPYLRGVDDHYDDVASNAYHRWSVTMSWSDFSEKLNAHFGTGELQSFEILAPLGVSGRVTAVNGTSGGVRIVGSKTTVRASGASVRSALGLRDTLFSVTYSN